MTSASDGSSNILATKGGVWSAASGVGGGVWETGGGNHPLRCTPTMSSPATTAHHKPADDSPPRSVSFQAVASSATAWGRWARTDDVVGAEEGFDLLIGHLLGGLRGITASKEACVHSTQLALNLCLTHQTPPPRAQVSLRADNNSCCGRADSALPCFVAPRNNKC